MNRRGFLAALGVAPAALVPTAAMSSAPQEFDYGRSVHAPLSDDDRAVIDSLDEAQLREAFRSIFANARLGSMAGRCNSAFTMGACFKNRDYVVDVDFIRSLIPRINKGLLEDFDALMSPAMRYGLSRCVEGIHLAPLTITGFLQGELDGWERKITVHHFTHVIPGHRKGGEYAPHIVDSRFA